MKMQMYALKDNKTGCFMTPFPGFNDVDAIRLFECRYNDELRLRPSAPMAMFIGDYDLYAVGEYDDETGVFDSVGPCLTYSGKSFLSAAQE